MKKLLNKTYQYALFIILAIFLIVLIYFRDIPNKPIIDILIPSISSILAAFVAAFVALKVADYQISHNESKEKQIRERKLISRVKLLKKELEYNENQLKSCLDQYTAENESAIAKAVALNLKSELWSILAVEIIEDLEETLFNDLIELYYKISRLQQEQAFELSLCNATFSGCSAINSKIDLLLKNPELLQGKTLNTSPTTN